VQNEWNNFISILKEIQKQFVLFSDVNANFSVHFIERAKSFLIPTVHSYSDSVIIKCRLDLQLLFRRHFPWPIPISGEN